MKRFMLMLTVTLIAALSISCAAESSDGKNMTKLGICQETFTYYCDKASGLGCDWATACQRTWDSYCSQLFDGTCEAQGDIILHIRNDVIPRWIGDKTTCESLNSLASPLSTEFTGTVAPSDCVSVADQNTNDAACNTICQRGVALCTGDLTGCLSTCDVTGGTTDQINQVVSCVTNALDCTTYSACLDF